jgi:hypothetical protein
MVLDPRYDTEGWMRSHVRPGDRIEVYGDNVHLPRFLAGEVVERVDSTPVDSRNPLPGVLEVNDRLSNVGARRPRFIVVPEFWAHEFLIDPAWAATVGRTLSATQRERLADTDSTGYVHALYDGRLAYHWAHVSTWESRIWPRVNIHASLARDVWIFERNDGP